MDFGGSVEDVEKECWDLLSLAIEYPGQGVKRRDPQQVFAFVTVGVSLEEVQW